MIKYIKRKKFFNNNVMDLQTSDISENEQKYVNEEYLLKPNIDENYGFFKFQINLCIKTAAD